jgi:hypothetical protein
MTHSTDFARQQLASAVLRLREYADYYSASSTRTLASDLKSQAETWAAGFLAEVANLRKATSGGEIEAIAAGIKEKSDAYALYLRQLLDRLKSANATKTSLVEEALDILEQTTSDELARLTKEARAAMGR